ncbi:MAG: twitching motility protein PilT [Gammaproteobacteria bacterium]|nr:twitching motility protein PilT [Gammaproteobacteria bacterium]
MSKVVLDSSAMIAFLFSESGAESVRPYLGQAYLSYALKQAHLTA